MKLPDESFERGEVDVMRLVSEHADATAQALPAISGPDVRKSANIAVNSTGMRRGRLPFLAAAAAVVIAGGTAFALNRAANDTRLEAVPPADTAVDEPDPTVVEPEPEAEVKIEVAEPDSEASVDAAVPDFMPRPVAPADFGTADLRFLPPPDSDFVVASGSRVLMSEAKLEPEPSVPVRTQRVSLPASDPADRASIVLLVSTYADEAAADAVVARWATPTDDDGGSTDINGWPATWQEEEGFAPFSAGNPMRVIRSLHVQLDATTLVGVAAPDVPRAEIAALVASLVQSGDGVLEAPNPPAGFDSAEPIDGLSPQQVTSNESAGDYLAMVMVGVNGEQIHLTVSAESAGLSNTNAHFENADGFGWIESGLFSETVVSFVGPDVTLILANYDGQVTAEELIDLADSIQPVDDETWAERLAVAPLHDAPVSAVPPGE